MRTTMIVIACVAAGCSFHSSASPTDGRMIDTKPIDAIDATDAAIDVMPDGPNMDFGDDTFVVHVATLPTMALALPMTIDTSTSSLCSPNVGWASATQPTACFVLATTITSGAMPTNVTGTKPLVLVATDSIILTRPVDVSSKKAMMLGAGGNSSACAAFVQAPADDASGGGGGAGGSFMTRGGVGGTGNANSAASGTSALADLGAPTLLRGGCAGQTGATAGGAGGNGGGAVYLVAANAITLSSTINAGGGGGAKGTGNGHNAGGSGGGSGGMIVLYSPQITATGATLMANGAGASSGGTMNASGQDGTDASMAMTAAAGGSTGGGPGGAGAILTTDGVGGTPGGGSQGGGGGGGGVGYIRSNVTLTAVASPAVDVVP